MEENAPDKLVAETIEFLMGQIASFPADIKQKLPDENLMRTEFETVIRKSIPGFMEASKTFSSTSSSNWKVSVRADDLSKMSEFQIQELDLTFSFDGVTLSSFDEMDEA